jgi:hypothetical protein
MIHTVGSSSLSDDLVIILALHAAPCSYSVVQAPAGVYDRPPYFSDLKSNQEPTFLISI